MHAPIPHLPDTRRGPAGPSPNSKGGGTGHGRQQAAHGPTTGPAHPLPSPPPEGRWGAGCSTHMLLAATTGGTTHSGATAAGGSGTPRLPLRSLEKAFSPSIHHPSPGSSLSFGPTEVLHEPPILNCGWEGSAVQVGRAPTQEHLHSQGRARILSPARPHPSASMTRGMGMPLLPPRPLKENHSRDTPPWWGPEDTGVKENTTTQPQAPEQQPGALQGHHQRSNKARSHTHTE